MSVPWDALVVGVGLRSMASGYDWSACSSLGHQAPAFSFLPPVRCDRPARLLPFSAVHPLNGLFVGRYHDRSSQSGNLVTQRANGSQGGQHGGGEERILDQ